MSDAAITFLTLGVAIGLFMWNRVPVAVVALGAALALYVTGVISAEQAFSGFGDPTVIFIASLFVIAEALDATGVTTWASARLVAAAGDRPGRLVLYVLLLSAGLSAILTPNGAVAALLPMTVLVALRLSRAPSKLLIPMAFAAHAGQLLVLTGSPVNVLVADEAGRDGVGRFGFFEFALVGVPLTIGVLGAALLLGQRLLPERRPKEMSADFSDHARTLTGQYDLDPQLLVRHEVPDRLFTRRTGVAEVIVPPRSPLIAERAFPGMVTDRGDLVVLGVQRAGRDRPRETELLAGDTLLLEGTWDALGRRIQEGAVLPVDAPDDVRRQVVPMGAGAKRALVVLLGMIAVLASGLAPAAVAGALAAMALVLLRVVEIDRAYRTVSWTTVILIAGLIPVTEALKTTGAADDVASALLDALGDAGPHALLIGLFVIATVLSLGVSNTATALILIPIGVAAAHELDVSAKPVLMSLAIACSASFLTPISTPGNLMIMEPAGYRFGDYWRLGSAMLLVFFLVAVFLVPVIWAF